MRVTLFLLLLSVTTMSFAQTRLYTNPRFDQIAEDHQVIAVAPFNASVNLRPNQMAQLTPEEFQELELSEGKNLQAALYSWFLKRQQRRKLSVHVQSVAETNTILAREGIDAKNMEEYSPSEIAGILGVDAVIMGTLETDKPMSEGAAFAIGALVGFWGTTNRVVVNLFIYNAEDGAVLVNYNKAVQGGSGSDVDQLINILMRKASRRIAYTK